MSEVLTDNDIFENEIKCIKRRSSGQCNGGTDCCTCDLLMNDKDIISAYERAMQANETINRLQAEIKRLTKEKDKAWELFKKKCDEDIELQGLCDKRRIENEKLHVGTVEKTRALFQAMVNKFMSIKDLYVIVDGEYLPWEPAEEVEHLFGMSISGDNDENDKETDRVIKELVGEDNG